MTGPNADSLEADEIPEAIRAKVANTKIELSAHTDLGLDGGPAKTWLLVADQKLWVVDEDDDGPELSLALDQTQGFRAAQAIGSGFLQVKVADTWVDLVRFGKGESASFSHFAKRLEALTADRPIEFAHKNIGPRCLACGHRLAFAGEICPRCADRGALLRRLLTLLYPFRWPALGLFILVLGGIGLSLIPPKLTQILIDDVLQADQPDARLQDTLLLIVVALGLTRVVGSALGWLKGLVSMRLGTRLTATLRERLVEKLHALPISFYDQNQVPHLSTRVARDTEALQNLIDHLTNGFVLRFIQFIAVGLMLFIISPKLASFALLPAPLVVIGSLVFWRYVHPKYFRLADSHGRQATSLAGMLYGVRVVKAFAQEQRELSRFRDSSNYFRDTKVDVGTSATTYGMSMSLIFSLGGLIVWYAGGRDVLQGEMTIGSLMAFFGYLSMFYAPLSTLSQFTTWLSGFTAACVRVLELLDTPEDVVDPDLPERLGARVGTIRFEEVTFGYDRTTPVLKEINLEIPKGQMVGIVGSSGSGKTTLVNLICRFYDVTEGRITIDGIDVKDVARAELRRRIGVVLQETFLFRGTIWENLTYGNENATPRQVIAMAKAAWAHDFIVKMPFGYDTALAERGTNLSGGERQRIAITRALLYEPDILILDEATSNLDTESERAVQDALEVLNRGKTVLAIAHRLSTLRHAERILVFEKGELVEDGSHEALVEKDGVYARLLKLQARIAVETPVDRLSTSQASNKATERSLFEPRWLTPESVRLSRGDYGATVLQDQDQDQTYSGIVATLAFHTRPDEYISLRKSDGGGPDQEIGIIENLSEWDVPSQRQVRALLARRYHLPIIETVDGIRLEFGLLSFRVQTDRGPKSFKMRWAQSHAMDYASRGKVLTDVLDNKYLIPDLETLPKNQQALVRRFIYW